MPSPRKSKKKKEPPASDRNDKLTIETNKNQNGYNLIPDRDDHSVSIMTGSTGSVDAFSVEPILEDVEDIDRENEVTVIDDDVQDTSTIEANENGNEGNLIIQHEHESSLTIRRL